MLRIAAQQWYPFTILESSNGSVIVKGVMGSLLRALFDRKHISYSVLAVDADHNFGIPLPNKSWTGQSGLLQRAEVDIMLGPAVMSAPRLEIMDFSWPFIYDRIGILSHSYDAKVTFDYLRGLDFYIWSLILITLSLSILLFMLKEWLIFSSIDGKLIAKYLEYYLQLVLAKSYHSVSQFPRDRCLAATLMLGISVLTICANTMIGVDLVVNSNKDLINTLAELALQTSCTPVSIKNTISGFIFMSAHKNNLSDENEIQVEIGQKMIEINESQCSDEVNIKRLVNRQWAYVMSETRLNSISRQVCQRRPDTQLYIGNEKSYFHLRALGISRLSVSTDLKKAIDNDIKHILSSGLLNIWMSRSSNRSDFQEFRCMKTEESLLKNKENAVFTLDSLYTFFSIVMYLLVASILIACVELSIFHIRMCNLKKPLIAHRLSISTRLPFIRPE